MRTSRVLLHKGSDFSISFRVFNALPISPFRCSQPANTVDVIITVDDVNDNPPSLPSNTTFGVARDAALMTLVGVVKGEDRDQGVNAELRYTLTNGQLHLFSLDPSTGELRVASPLEASNYLLTVTATDEQGQGLSAKGDVLVSTALR